VEFDRLSVEWMGHSSVKVSDNGFTVAVDPFSEVIDDFSADIVLVTHSHDGHFDEEALRQVGDERTVYVLPDNMDNPGIGEIEFLREGEVLDIYGVEVEGVPMYNDKHMRGEGLGYVFSMESTLFYMAGDTGLTQEMFDLEGRIDVAFFPVEGVFTMDVTEAVKATVRVKPELAVPYHYGEPFFPGKRRNAEEYAAELERRSIQCELLD